MKRLISMLVLIAMMFTMVMAAVPAWADEATGDTTTGDTTTGDTTTEEETPTLPPMSTEVVATYNVNWKTLGDLGTMRSQWLYERQPGQNNMDKKYNITLTETELKLSTGDGKGGDHRQYYSEVMFDLTADTQYVYEFEVDTTPGDLGGAIFAFANNPKARDEGDGKKDIFGVNISDMIACYYIAGNLNSGSADLKFGGYWANYGYEDEKNIKEDLKDAKVSEDGYTKYKITYNGLTVKFYYENTTGEYTELYADKTITLAEGAKLAFGSYTRSEHVGNLKNCVVYAMNDAAAEVIENGYLNSRITLADAMLARAEGTYTPATRAALDTACTAAKAVATNKDATAEQIAEAAAALAEKITTIRVAANKTPLKESIDKANAAIEGKTAADFVERYYTPFKEALDAAILIRDDVEAIQSDVDPLKKALDNTLKYLTPAGQACVIDLTAVLTAYAALKETDYTPNTWVNLATPYANAKALSENEALTDANQTEIDNAVKALDDAIKALVKRANFGVLNTTITRAEALDMTDYKPESIDANFAQLIADGKVVLADLNATQEAVDAAVKAISDAVAKLVAYRSNVLAIVPADDYEVNDKESYPNPNYYNKITDMSYHGLGNVFYYDYHKVLAATKTNADKWANYQPGQVFPESMKALGWSGSADYVLRLSKNISGSGTNRVTDGYKLKNDGDDNNLNHRANPTIINGKTYGHAYGFSFAKAPTVDSVAFYLPTNTNIASIDVYGAVLGQTEDGKVLYGKANKNDIVEVDGAQCEDATTAKKIYLGTINVPAAVAGADNIMASGDLAQAMKVDYIYFALTMKSGVGANAYYMMFEVELYGLNDGVEVADFTALNAAYDIYTNSIATDYTEESWNAVLAVIEQYKNVINNVFSAQADVTAAAEALDAALKALVLKPTDWTAIDAALATVADANAFTPATYEAFKAIYDAVVALRAQANVPQSVADAALAELNTAIASLEKRANTTALKAALDDAKTLKEDEWNGDKIKWKMFANAIAEAEALLANENATQAQVDKVVEDLAFRKSELVKVDKPATPTPAPGDPVDPGDPGDGTEKPTEKVTDKETEKDTEKGTETEKETDEEKKGCGSSVALSALAIVGVIGTAVVLKKKED